MNQEIDRQNIDALCEIKFLSCYDLRYPDRRRADPYRGHAYPEHS